MSVLDRFARNVIPRGHFASTMSDLSEFTLIAGGPIVVGEFVRADENGCVVSSVDKSDYPFGVALQSANEGENVQIRVIDGNWQPPDHLGDLKKLVDEVSE